LWSRSPKGDITCSLLIGLFVAFYVKKTKLNYDESILVKFGWEKLIFKFEF